MNRRMNQESILDSNKKPNKMRVLIPKNKGNNPPAMLMEKYSEAARSLFDIIFNKKKILPAPKSNKNRIPKTMSHSFVRTSQLSKMIFTGANSFQMIKK